MMINRTGRDGRFDNEVDFAPDSTQAREPVDVLVIQAAERPEDN